jgi:hypothetical protein
MKIHRLLSLFLVLFFTLSFSQREGGFYQVITSHPHDIEAILPQVETVYKNGRLWVVRPKTGASQEIFSHLRPLSGNEKSFSPKREIVKRASKTLTDLRIEALLSKIDQSGIQNDVIRLAEFETRFAGTPENQLATQMVAQRFSDLGFEVKEQCYELTACNIIAEKKGKSSEVLLVIGHLDSVGASFAGADDNASGVSVMLEMARVLRDVENKKTLRFVVTNGEELGLLGSSYYVRQLKKTELGKIKLVIAMDMVAYNSNGVVELETNPQFEDLALWFSHLAEKFTKLTTKITLGAWGSDHIPFLQKGIPTLLTLENWDTKTPCYHQECDKPDTLNYEYAAEIAKLNLAALLTKDSEAGTRALSR